MENPTIGEIIYLFVKTNGYDGLCNNDLHCACDAEDFSPCSCCCDCVPAYKHLGADGIVYYSTEKPETRSKTMAVNKVILVGNLGKDPEFKALAGGGAVANMTLATSEKWKDKDGKQQEKTEWHRLVAFGNLAELCRDYLAKGRQVYFEGKLQTREWVGKDDGVKRYTTEVVVQVVQFLGKAEGKAKCETEDPQVRAKQEQQEMNAPHGPDSGDDDIPF